MRDEIGKYIVRAVPRLINGVVEYSWFPRARSERYTDLKLYMEPMPVRYDTSDYNI